MHAISSYRGNRPTNPPANTTHGDPESYFQHTPDTGVEYHQHPWLNEWISCLLSHTLSRNYKFQDYCIWIPGLCQGFRGPWHFSQEFQAWKSQHSNSRTFQDFPGSVRTLFVVCTIYSGPYHKYTIVQDGKMGHTCACLTVPYIKLVWISTKYTKTEFT